MRHRGVEDAGAVQVHGHAGGMGGRRQRGDLLGGAAGAPVAIVRVLDADEAGDGQVDIAGADGVAHLGRGEEATLGDERAGLQPAQSRRAAHLRAEHVAIGVEEDLLAGLGLREDGNEVALGPGSHEESGLLPRPPGRQRLEALDGGIFLPHVVADLGLRHGLAHRRAGERERVRSQLDDVVHPGYLAAVRRRCAARRPHSV